MDYADKMVIAEAIKVLREAGMHNAAKMLERLPVMHGALWAIVNTMRYFQLEAEKEGGRLSAAAYSIANDPSFLRDLARKAIEN